jgi:gas vesicle protein
MGDNNGGSKFIYFLAGVSVGALIGLLYAPQSGKETRDYLAERAEGGRDYLSRKGREFREQATEYVEKGKGILTQQREHLSAAVEAGKQAYRTESQKRPVD